MIQIWKQFQQTGSAALAAHDRARRVDCHLTMGEIDWLAERILDAPDLLLDELRTVFVTFFPQKSWIGLYPIAQAMQVCVS